MPDQYSLQELERIEGHFQRLIDLLTSADQAISEMKEANDAFNRAHHLNAERSRTIEETIKNIESLIAQATHIHNEAVGKVREAKEEAAQRSDEQEGGESDSES